MYERCIALAWCAGCRVYSSALVHVPRTRPPADPLAALPPEERERLLRSERRTVEFLARGAHRDRG
ncbi:hypothetical protein ACIO7M_14330 [Streptomyces toxytricini]|uniref:Uncharacterized protein n=1 Tax=Streptomyces toxytricini TaxID=67369 RepID=A0ABW8EI29_STRT5